MFATLAGGYPPARRGPESPLDDPDDLVRAAVADQEAAGLEPITDGLLRWPDLFEAFALGLGGTAALAAGRPRWRGATTIAAWQFAAGCTDRAVKQGIAGPYSLARRALPGRSAAERERLTLRLAALLHREVVELAEAGCPLVQVEEPGAIEIGSDEQERALFRTAQEVMTDGLAGVHLSLAITGGNADLAGPSTIFAAPYASYLFDLLAGPDNWRLIALAPPERGIVCGAADARTSLRDHKELLLWAAHYAASTQGRGLERVGLATSGSLAGLTVEQARAKIAVLGEAARLSGMAPSAELAEALDPRALDIRSAAYGRYAGREPHRESGTAGETAETEGAGGIGPADGGVTAPAAEPAADPDRRGAP